MNILETQVTDLNYLVESPVATATPTDMSMNDGRQSSTAAESPVGAITSGNGRKRNGDEISGGMSGNGGGSGSVNGGSVSANGMGAGQHTRAKRNRYISIAWYVPFLSSLLVLRLGLSTDWR